MVHYNYHILPQGSEPPGAPGDIGEEASHLLTITISTYFVLQGDMGAVGPPGAKGECGDAVS